MHLKHYCKRLPRYFPNAVLYTNTTKFYSDKRKRVRFLATTTEFPDNITYRKSYYFFYSVYIVRKLKCDLHFASRSSYNYAIPTVLCILRFRFYQKQKNYKRFRIGQNACANDETEYFIFRRTKVLYYPMSIEMKFLYFD